jgi:DNA-binding LacI/PurR family transcriptional regulator
VSVTMSDVAELAGVSTKTVSNYLNDYPYMKAETRARIESAIEHLNYRVNLSARYLRAGRTKTITLVIPEIDQAYFAELAQAIVSTAQGKGLTVLIETTGGDRKREMEILSGARGRLVDGVIFGPLALGGAELGTLNPDFPLVFIGDRVAGGTVDFVTMANAEAAQAAVWHLIGQGRRRIVALGADHASGPSAPVLRRLGYERALADAGIEVLPELIIGPLEWHRPAGAAAIGRLLDSGVEFDAVFGFNDALALGAMRELLRRGISIPGDVAIAGFDNTEDAIFSTPSLTTADPGREAIAVRAVDLLIERMAAAGNGGAIPDGVPPARSVVPDFSLVVRESSVVPRR